MGIMCEVTRTEWLNGGEGLRCGYATSLRSVAPELQFLRAAGEFLQQLQTPLGVGRPVPAWQHLELAQKDHILYAGHRDLPRPVALNTPASGASGGFIVRG